MEKKFKGSLGNYRLEITEDGSVTIFSEFFNESCHSMAGARSETLYNYIEGCGLPSWTDSLEEKVIFELGFGTGLGLQSTLDFTQSLKNFPPYLFVSTELDESFASYSLETIFGKKFELENKDGLQFFRGTHPQGEFIVLIGDARETTVKWRESSLFRPVDAIYQDAFSPKRCPKLWTTQWFETLASISKDSTAMGTYSSTKAVWKAMIKAGWVVKTVQGHGQKKLSTRAYRVGETSEELLELMKRSPKEALDDSQL